MIDYLALVGDAVDNIPGVAGIGAKGATQLLADHGSLDAMLAQLERDPSVFKGRALKSLTEGVASARLSQQLATIDQHVVLDVVMDDLALAPLEPTELNELYKELEFFSLLVREDAASAKDGSVDEGDGAWSIATSADDVRDALKNLHGMTSVVPLFDGRAVNGTLVALALSSVDVVEGTPRHATMVVWHDETAKALVSWLQDDDVKKVLHDAKETWVLLQRQGITLRGVAFDTQLASFLISPSKNLPHELGDVVKDALHKTLREKKAVTGSGQRERALKDLDAPALAAFGAHLVDAVASVAPILTARLLESGLTSHLHDVDLPLSWVLGRMEIAGIAVDDVELAHIGDELRARLADLERTIHGHAGKVFNIHSTKQLADVLFVDLKLPVITKTKSGYSTNAEVLEKLADEHEIARHLLEHRKIDKLLNTYIDVLRAERSSTTGRVHTTFQQTTGVTGRLITTDPDLQRTPVKTADGRRIRSAFVAVPRHGAPTRIISADWSQIELRLLAHVSNDPLLVDSFTHGVDVHRRTASAIFGVAPDDVTPVQRNMGKTVNFATIYGQGATSLAQILKIPRKEAQRYIDEYFRAYAGVRTWLDRTIEQATVDGYVETLLHRRRYIPELKSHSGMDRGFGERVAANTPIQGSAADICKLAMLRIDARLHDEAPRTRMLLQIHDELVFEAPLDDVERVCAIAKHEMEHVVPLHVPLIADVGVGKSWGEAH
jgi:DNA polymerase-1